MILKPESLANLKHSHTALVIRGTGLYELWKTGRYKNYSPDALVDLLAQILALVPPWTRVYRIQRDIPMPLVTSGVEYGNIRELVLRRMKDLGVPCRDVRTREVGIKQIHDKIRPDQVRCFFAFGLFVVAMVMAICQSIHIEQNCCSPVLSHEIQVEFIRRDYVANGGWESFLAYEDPKQDILVGLLRLRKCSPDTFREEMKNQQCSLVRELHVYGSAVPVHSRDPTKFQHRVLNYY